MFDEDAIIKELSFKAVRSSGAGGHHVNKVASKIELAFNLFDSEVLNDDQKTIIKDGLKPRISKDGFLTLQCSESRSQHRNKEIVIQRFLELLRVCLTPKKLRKKTKIPLAVKRKRLEQKKKQSEKKSSRRPPKLN